MYTSKTVVKKKVENIRDHRKHICLSTYQNFPLHAFFMYLSTLKSPTYDGSCWNFIIRCIVYKENCYVLMEKSIVMMKKSFIFKFTAI